MPERQQMEFVIRADGTVEERVTGVNGPDCESLTDGLERKLGDVVHREHTPEFYRGVQDSDEVSVKSTS